MIIDITEKPANRCWVVCMDDFTVSFNSLGDAQAFVGLLTARIEAPHVWPGDDRLIDNPRRAVDRPAAYADGERVFADPVE
ncbi:hypothetical protein [Pseudomonas sp. EA_5y_Pfl2_R50]|uniref:hypothetical protein n=1 Tax=Pseudomonas sp. EA_5y_Pfl2_R50 TaxID=3088691 RepID=UPI0030D89E4C